jgi:uncharacterized membrane protein YkvA (DUF1232 family)
MHDIAGIGSAPQRVPLLAKILIGAVVAYALSPIDLMPDFILVIGYIDDLLLLPLGIWIFIRLIPKDIWEECQALAQKQVFELPRNRRATAIIVFIWLLVTIGFLMWVRPFVGGPKGT